jgi:hypothetical protein
MRKLLSALLTGLTIILMLTILGSCGGATGLAVGWDYQDMDGDGVRNGIDADIDGDGVPNYLDVWPHDWRYY